jgi:hypothetical protein
LKQRIQATKRLGEILNSTAGVALENSETRVTSLRKIWTKLLPPEMAKSTRPIRFIRNQLEVDVLVSLTSEESAELDDRLSRVLPQYGVAGVNYRIGEPRAANMGTNTDVASSSARAKASTIKDPRLSAAMAKLITAFDGDKN